MRNNIYAGSEEKYVMSVVVYADKDDGNLFYDAEKKEGIAKDELLDLYLKGMTIFLSDEYLKPVAYKESAGAGMVTAIHENSSVAALNFYSSEHAAG